MAMLDWPSGVSVADYSIRLMRSVARPRSAYTYGEQQIDFGGEAWELTLTTASLTIAQAQELLAYAERVRDADDKARIRPFHSARSGTSLVSAVSVSSAASAYQRTVSLTGIGSGLTLGAGTFLSVGSRLHMLRFEITGDSAVAYVTPRLRESLGGGETVTVGDNAQGVFRLAEAPDYRLARPGVVEPMTFRFVEAVA